MDWRKPLAGLLVCLLGAGLAFAQELDLSAPSAILIEAASGRVLYEKEPHRRQPVASLVKIMTLVLALEELAAGRLHLDDPIVASPYASSMGGSQIWWEAGNTCPSRMPCTRSPSVQPTMHRWPGRVHGRFWKKPSSSA